MKKMKVASLALAGMMTVQTTMSYAQVSRVGNIGDKQIAEANQQIANLKMHFESLDKSLFDAAKAIQESEKSGRIPNGAAVIGATIGFAGAAVQLLSKSGEGTLLGAAIAFVGTATSLVTSGLSAALKEDAHTQATESSLAKAQNEVRAAKNSATDAAQAGLLIQLELSLSQVQLSLKAYRDDNSDRSLHKLTENIAQMAGAAILAYGVTHRESSEKLLPIAAVIMGAGDIGRVISGMTASQANQVLSEIERTRESLRIAIKALEPNK